MPQTDGTVRPKEDLLDPSTYLNSAALTERCDLVMKGGITSGVIYPHVVCQLAITKRLQRVGGTSAGAIAAGAAAAAELGRDAARADAGYPRLAALPANLAEITTGGHTRLYNLFQPQRSTTALPADGRADRARRCDEQGGPWPDRRNPVDPSRPRPGRLRCTGRPPRRGDLAGRCVGHRGGSGPAPHREHGGDRLEPRRASRP